MDQKARHQEAPDPTDLEGWRQAIAQRLLSKFRLEPIVAAFQDLGPFADRGVRDPLALHISNAMTGLLRRLVGTNHPNDGKDIIYRVHGQLFVALLKLGSADGKGLRENFTARVSFRVKDAIAREDADSRVPVAVRVTKRLKGRKVKETIELVPGSEVAEQTDELSDADEGSAANSNRDLSLLDSVRDLDQWIDVRRILEVVPDPRKRLAFYLHMEKVPCRSTRGYSIARALGISGKTAEKWIAEVQTILQAESEIQELQKLALGDRT
jgi:hypothetical protein